jgi:hypothetical protein
LLNKTDLVTPEELESIERTVRAINPSARIHRTERASVPLDAVLDRGAFDLSRALDNDPHFLDHDHPDHACGPDCDHDHTTTITITMTTTMIMTTVTVTRPGGHSRSDRSSRFRCAPVPSIRNGSFPGSRRSPRSKARIFCGSRGSSHLMATMTAMWSRAST